jgi:aryl-alcohol dehydrogenase-like predicted oxidoreductase
VELAFSWLATRPTVWSIIAGASTPAQVEQNAAACGWRLTAEDLAAIDRITAPAPIGSH